MLIELAIGDSYGQPFEFVKDKSLIPPNDLHYHVHPSRPDENILKGHYTDDTQMSIGLSRFLIEYEKHKNGPYAFIASTERISEYFQDTYARYPIMGYGGRIKAALKKSTLGCRAEGHGGERFIKALSTTISTANGSVMRSLPLGVVKNTDEIIKLAMMQAMVTHTTLDGVHGSIYMALASHYMYHKLYRNCRNNQDALTRYYHMYHWIHETALGGNTAHSPKIQQINGYPTHDKPVPCEAMKTVEAVFHLVLVSPANSLSEILKAAVDLGGDTDSVAALCMGLASMDDRIKKDLPRRLRDGLENGDYGKNFLMSLERELFKVYPPIAPLTTP